MNVPILGAPRIKESPKCSNKSRLTVVYRVDMEDRTGTAMCPTCVNDAMESGVFYTK